METQHNTTNDKTTIYKLTREDGCELELYVTSNGPRGLIKSYHVSLYNTGVQPGAKYKGYVCHIHTFDMFEKALMYYNRLEHEGYI